MSFTSFVNLFMLFCGVLVVGALVYIALRTGPALDAGRAWLALVQRLDYRAAYDAASKEFRERQSLADLEAFARRHRLSQHTELRLGRRAVDPEIAVFTGWLGARDGSSAIAISFALRVSPSGIWQPDRLEVGPAVGLNIARDGVSKFGPPGLYDAPDTSTEDPVATAISDVIPSMEQMEHSTAPDAR